MSTNVKDHGAVGDGTTNDTAAFEDALAVADYEVFIPAGVYLIDTNALKVPGAVVVRGEGDASVLKRTPGGSRTNILTIDDSDHVVVKDLRFDGSRDEPGTNDLGGTLDIGNAWNVLVQDVTFEETHSFGVRLVWSCKKIRLRGLKLVNTGSTAIRVTTPSNFADFPMDDLLIDDCVVDKRDSDTIGAGIQIQARQINHINNLRIHNCQVLMNGETPGMGIELLGTDLGGFPSMFDVSVRNCYITGTKMGLTCGSVEGFVYDGNIIKDCNNTGIEFSNHHEGVISGNVVSTTEGIGMAGFQGVNERKSRNVIIADNVVNDAVLAGVTVVGGLNITVHDNLVRSERMIDGSGPKGRAFRFYDVHRLKVHDNLLDGIDAATKIARGIEIANCDRVLVNHNAGRNVDSLYEVRASGTLVPDVKGTFFDNVALENVTTETFEELVSGATNSIINWPNVHSVG